MNDSSNICLSCGLCCDGSLIGFVQLDSDELPSVKAVMDIEEEGGKGFFLQPCQKYCDGCTIYSQRPKACDHFNCKLLKSVQQKELDFNSAVETIQDVKAQKQAIEKKIGQLGIAFQSPSFYFKMVELKNILQKLKDESTLNTRQQELIIELQELDELLLAKFGVTLD